MRWGSTVSLHRQEESQCAAWEPCRANGEKKGNKGFIISWPFHRHWYLPPTWWGCHSLSRCPFPSLCHLSPTPTYFQRLSLYVCPFPFIPLLIRVYSHWSACVVQGYKDVENTSWAPSPPLTASLPPRSSFCSDVHLSVRLQALRSCHRTAVSANVCLRSQLPPRVLSAQALMSPVAETTRWSDKGRQGCNAHGGERER